MTALTEQEAGWIHEVATRLRLIQTDTARLEANKRSEFLEEEVDRCFKAVSPANRKRLMEALLARFPVAGKVVGGNPAPATVPAPLPSTEPESLHQIFDKLLAVLPTSSEQDRQAVVRRISEAGLFPTEAGVAKTQIPGDFAQTLGLSAGQSPDLERLVQLTVELLGNLYRLDQAALKTMETLAPRSALLRRSESFRRSATRFLTGEADSIETQLKEVSGLMGALLAAILGGGRVFGQQYVERFSPTAIEDVVMAEGGGGMFGPSKKERCWDRYIDLSRDFTTPDLVDRRVRECLASVVQRTVEKGSVVGR